MDAPIFSPDGRWLYAAGAEDLSGNIFAVGSDGKNEHAITDLKGRRGALVSKSLATDGRSVYFSWQEDLGDLWVADLGH